MFLKFIEYRLTSLFRKVVRHFIFNVSIQPLPSFTPTTELGLIFQVAYGIYQKQINDHKKKLQFSFDIQLYLCSFTADLMKQIKTPYEQKDIDDYLLAHLLSIT